MAEEKGLERLQQVRERTLLDIERLRGDLQAEIEPASLTDDDHADIAADVYERSKIISLIRSLETKLRAVEHAIEVAAKGLYGICEVCGERIPDERLAIMPETTLCVRCAERLEQGIRRHQILTEERERRVPFVEEDEEVEEDIDYDDLSADDE